MDPTPEQVAAAIATLEAFEHAQHPVAAPAEPVKLSEVIPAEIIDSQPIIVEPITAAPVDPYVARSLKDSPNGF